MKFRSPTDEPVRLAMTSGHITQVGPDWTELPEIFHEAATRAGCISERMAQTIREADAKAAGESRKTSLDEEGPPTQKVPTGKDRASVIERAVALMLDKGDPDDFNKTDGRPNLSRLREALGIEVTSDERDAAWETLTSQRTNKLRA